MISPHYTSPNTHWMLVLLPITVKWPLIKQESKELIKKNKTLDRVFVCAVYSRERRGESFLVNCYSNYEEIMHLKLD